MPRTDITIEKFHDIERKEDHIMVRLPCPAMMEIVERIQKVPELVQEKVVELVIDRYMKERADEIMASIDPALIGRLVTMEIARRLYPLQTVEGEAQE